MIYVIPDTQIRPGVKNPLVVVAHHICMVKPSQVVSLGDNWDMPSLSRYDKGKKSHRVTSYLADINAGNDAMAEFWAIIKKKWKSYKEDCTWVILEGNHEHRRTLALEYCDDNVHDLIASKTYDLSNWEIKVPFLEVIRLHGIEFSHYFSNSGTGRPISNAKALLTQRHVSSVAGHKQGFEYAEMLKGKDDTIQALIIGSCYYHKENYKNHTNHHWRGSILLSQVENSTGFDYARFSLETLDKMYENEV